MEKYLSDLFSIVPPKPDHDPVRKAAARCAEDFEVASVLRQFASMPPSTAVLANPVRHHLSVVCGQTQLQLNIRSFSIRGLLFEEDIVTGAADPLRVIFVGLFGRFPTGVEMNLFSGFISRSFASAVDPAGPILQLAKLMKTFPETAPDIAMQHGAALRKARYHSRGINTSRSADELLAEMIQVHIENTAVATCASYMRALLQKSPRMTETGLVSHTTNFIRQANPKNPLWICYSLLRRRAVSASEARIFDRLGAIQVHHGSAGSNMVARYLASLHTRAVSDLFTAAQMALDGARHFGAIADMSDFIRELEGTPHSRRDETIRQRMLQGNLPTFGHPEIAAAGRGEQIQFDPRPALYVAPLFEDIDAGELNIPEHIQERLALAQQMYQIAFIEGIAKPGGSGRLRVAPNTDFGAWLVQEALGIEESDRTLLSYAYRGFGWMMDVREQLQQPIIRPVIAPDPGIVPGPSADTVIPSIVSDVHERLRLEKAFAKILLPST
ncbi:MAG: hypothetical protein DMG13_12120 [Acidobacteria bacterium]|nr:MAG: hypothetical protein DMG13_12120 [Acidobacteriota bacterium]